jgi:hypothetical protein
MKIRTFARGLIFIESLSFMGKLIVALISALINASVFLMIGFSLKQKQSS